MSTAFPAPIPGPAGERIYRLPLRAIPGLEVNAYVVIDGDYAALIDTGTGWPTSDEDLFAGFDALRTHAGESVRLETLSRIILTHGHIDHYGGFDAVRLRSDAPVALHAYDRVRLEDPRGHHQAVGEGLRRFFVEAGLSPVEAAEAFETYHGAPLAFRGGPVTTTLADGDTLDGRFTVLHTPGHCPGHVCLQLGDLLFSADHVLPDTFPHLAPERFAPWAGVTHYTASLARIAALPTPRLTLPGHGQPFAALGERIGQLRESSDRMLGRVAEACRDGRTLRDVTRLIYPSVQGFQQGLALEKVAAFAEALAQRGAISFEASAGQPWRFTRPAAHPIDRPRTP